MRSWLERVWPRRDAAASAVERWLVLDVETTGLDVHRDQLLAIAAVGVRVDWPARRIAPAIPRLAPMMRVLAMTNLRVE